MAEFKITPSVEKQIKKNMEVLKIDYEEALDIVRSDWLIDHGERTEFDLDKDAEKQALKNAHKGEGRKPTIYKFDKPRQRKENPTKAGIIAEIAKFLAENSENACENVTITNKERQIAFKIGENDYEFTLVQKRKPKN